MSDEPQLLKDLRSIDEDIHQVVDDILTISVILRQMISHTILMDDADVKKAKLCQQLLKDIIDRIKPPEDGA